MRIEVLQNPIHRHIYNAICIHIVYIFIVDIIDKPIQFFFFGICREKFIATVKIEPGA